MRQHLADVRVRHYVRQSFERGPRCGRALGSGYARKLVRPRGLEPMTFGSGVTRSFPKAGGPGN